VPVARKAFGSGIELVHSAGLGGYPQISLIVLYEIRNKVGA
jgi:hypothetical protein